MMRSLDKETAEKLLEIMSGGLVIRCSIDTNFGTCESATIDILCSHKFQDSARILVLISQTFQNDRRMGYTGAPQVRHLMRTAVSSADLGLLLKDSWLSSSHAYNRGWTAPKPFVGTLRYMTHDLPLAEDNPRSMVYYGLMLAGLHRYQDGHSGMLGYDVNLKKAVGCLSDRFSFFVSDQCHKLASRI